MRRVPFFPVRIESANSDNCLEASHVFLRIRQARSERTMKEEPGRLPEREGGETQERAGVKSEFYLSHEPLKISTTSVGIIDTLQEPDS